MIKSSYANTKLSQNNKKNSEQPMFWNTIIGIKAYVTSVGV